MNLLALETSGLQGGVACFAHSELLKTIELPSEDRSARTLLPAIQQIMSDVTWEPQELDLIAVTIGPGSFTGLRVGVTTAKTLAYATNSQTIGVNTLDVVAHRAFQTTNEASPNYVDGPLHVVMDAQRKQFFWAIYERLETSTAQSVMRKVRSLEIIDQQAWATTSTSGVWVTGPGLQRVRSQVGAARLVEESLWGPTAVAVGQVALARLAEHGPDDLWKLAPEYYRKSAAEEKRGSK